ncbi:chromosomal replication initiator DnaA [Aquicoccus porphyridii]|uniref:Chromosomal replication initiator DnaA n=1 Tax=Aquicoccus porphyridii TaxID=1852029 RepID=A0A5A9YY68_9RHOB|nr:DnaA/Hda family protein [Aquicoccus porphyridii]KAA0909845.1 chromosomal replication initiator DnaA [Aquicoccus porphyridii]RAI53242.1 chromosomal replication initiator DnaA [Rhodobacteraceae bacterium AsT-22]
MARQLRFDLPVRTAHGREDFFVSPANAQAVAMIEGWADWPGRKLALLGPSGAGKTHLAHVWAALSGATIVAAQDLAGHDIPRLARTSLVIEDVPMIAGDIRAEEALFHLHNLALAEGHALLFTAHTAPARWGLALPDLQSRMEGTTAVIIAPPDDDLLAAVLMKLFTDRQLSPTPDTIPYLLRHIDRSFDTARRIVAALDEAALDQGREINRRLAIELVGRLAG